VPQIKFVIKVLFMTPNYVTIVITKFLFLLITIFTVSDFRDVFSGIVFRIFFSLCKKIVLGLFFKDKNKTNISSQKSKDTYYQTDDNYIIFL
jgi:hypothetical protein